MTTTSYDIQKRRKTGGRWFLASPLGEVRATLAREMLQWFRENRHCTFPEGATQPIFYEYRLALRKKHVRFSRPKFLTY